MAASVCDMPTYGFWYILIILFNSQEKFYLNRSFVNSHVGGCCPVTLHSGCGSVVGVDDWLFVHV